MDYVQSHVEFVTAYETAFRRHYQLTYHHTGRPYEWYEPAYNLGYELVTLHHWGSRSWSQVERKAQRLWKKQGHDLSSWEEVKAAVEYAMNETKKGIGLQEVDDHEQDFYAHYQSTYSKTGHAYDNYRPAYRYGTQLAYDERYMRRLWPKVELEARQGWADRHDTPWDDVSDAIQYAWSQGLGPQDDTDELLVTGDDDEFRAHYVATDAAGRPYEFYEPAYYFGYDLAYRRPYRDQPWEVIEPEVRRAWESSGYDTPWDEIKGAVHHAWRQVRNAFELRG